MSNIENEHFPQLVPISFMKKVERSVPLSAQFIQDSIEYDEEFQKGGSIDPIGDNDKLVAPQLIHRYSNRVLFLPVKTCPVNCRYCFRKNEIHTKGFDDIFSENFSQTLHYLEEHPEIDEIIFTGGDPFSLNNNRLEFYLQAFSKLSNIKNIRFHTRYTTVLSKRFTTDLLNILVQYLNNFENLIIVTHTNHPDEFCSDVENLFIKIDSLGLKHLTQSVLLKGVNDNPEILISLFKKISSLRAIPYYLHHPDKVKGAMHFYLDLEIGRKIYSELRKSLSGWQLPQYIIDIPGGHGKVSAYNPETFRFSGSLISQNSSFVQYH